MAEQVSSHTPKVGGDPQPDEVNTPVSPREVRLVDKLTGVIRQTLEEHKKNNDNGKEEATGESSREMTRHPSFKTFKSSGATEFSGFLNPIVVLTWIQNIEKVLCISHVDNEDTANYAPAMLTGEALVWREATYEALNGFDQDNLSWELFKTHFLGKYCPLDMSRRLEKEFLELKQGGMIVNDYETQFNQKAWFVYEIRDFVTNRDVLSFDKVVEYARKSEHDLEIRGATLFVPKHPHIDRTAYVQTHNTPRGHGRSQSFSLQSPLCRNCGNNHPVECRLEKGSVVCYGCGEVGHMKYVCPMKNVTCFACGVAGHKKRFCPTLTSQMTGSQVFVQQPARSQAPAQQPKSTPTKKEEVPKVKGRAFQITTEEAREDPNVVTGTFLVNSSPAHILFDSGAGPILANLRPGAK
ncbi:uncharacterized protein LOC128126098 [Lactuca sativa]|uniref:uncharacterized protein LOC128126098 n=1 Tax=Lactuca sativa TaxID=4236 RepID=UPI0022AFA633|nr:uncharacterized protein LOC128126098 [Lactuca sativa]